jgi:beta-glucosidase
VFYDYLKSGRFVDPGEMNGDGPMRFGHSYVDNTPEPLYEFGFGKSYTSFSYGNLTLSPRNAKASDVVTASVRVWNTGRRDGTEVVQLYVDDLITSVVVPNQQLKGFKKVSIKAGEFSDVEIQIKVRDLGLWNSQYRYVVEPGEFRFWVGASSKDLKSQSILTVA